MLGIQPLKRSRLVDSVSDQLRKRIVTNEIPPGTRLLQVDVAQQLGVSRTPLREAFRVLEREGLVRISNGNNTVEVVDFSSEEVDEILALREVLDGLAARIAAERELSADDDAELVALCMRLSNDEFVPTQYAEDHIAYHAKIVDLAGNTWLTNAIMPLLRMTSQVVMQRMAQAVTGQERRLRTLLHETEADHVSICEAIRAGNAPAAEAAARDHIRKTRASWIIVEGFRAAGVGLDA